MAKNYSGRDYLLYLGTTAPSGTGDDHTDNYTLVGGCTDLSVSQSRNAIDKSSKDDGDNSTFIAGRRNSTISGTFLWDHTEDGGLTEVDTAIKASNGTVYFIVTTTTASDEEWYGSGIVTQFDLSFPDEGVSSTNVTIQVSGALTQNTGT